MIFKAWYNDWLEMIKLIVLLYGVDLQEHKLVSKSVELFFGSGIILLCRYIIILIDICWQSVNFWDPFGLIFSCLNLSNYESLFLQTSLMNLLKYKNHIFISWTPR